MYQHTNTSAAIYGLTCKARCITAQLAESEKNRFLVGTLSLREDNEIHLIEVRESDGDITCVNIFNHPCEIWSLTCSPNNPALFFSCYNTGVEFKASLWRMIDTNPSLEEVVEIKGHQGTIKCILWDPAGNSDVVVSLDDSNVRVWELENSYTNPKAVRTFGNLPRLFTGCLNPNHSNLLATANDTSIRGWDLRTGKDTYVVEKAHTDAVRDLDFNPNRQYILASAGDDCCLKFWDVRNTKAPVKVLQAHSHWVWNVRYNRLHDQLVVSSSSDHLVKLWNVVSISSALRNDDEESPLTTAKPSKKAEDQLIKTFEEHEDSVYSVAWAVSNWHLFASLSYDGRVVINYVPKEYADILKY